MQFFESYVPTAGQVGLVAMLTEWILLAAMHAFCGGALFFLVTRHSVAPRFRAAAVLSGTVCLVWAFSYWTISGYFHDLLHQLAATADAPSRRSLIHNGYLAIAPYRRTASAITLPLLACLVPLSLPVRFREMLRPLAALFAAVFFGVLAGLIGEQQIAPDGAVLVVRRCAWIVLELAAFAAAPVMLLRWVAPHFGGGADHDHARAFRLMAWITVSWCVYPLASLLAIRATDANWLHLLVTAVDLLNGLGLGAIGYLAGAAELERRVPHEAVQSARVVG